MEYIFCDFMNSIVQKEFRKKNLIVFSTKSFLGITDVSFNLGKEISCKMFLLLSHDSFIL